LPRGHRLLDALKTFEGVSARFPRERFTDQVVALASELRRLVRHAQRLERLVGVRQTPGLREDLQYPCGPGRRERLLRRLSFAARGGGPCDVRPQCGASEHEEHIPGDPIGHRLATRFTSHAAPLISRAVRGCPWLQPLCCHETEASPEAPPSPPVLF